MLSVRVRKDGIDACYIFPWPVSIVAFMANPRFLKGEMIRETVETLASDPFFDMIEVSPLTSEQWREAEKAIEGAGVVVAVGAQPVVLMQGKNPSSLDEAARKEAVEAIKKVVEESAAHGVKSVAFCSGPDPGVGKRREAKEALIRSLKEIAEFAKDLGVTVILETFDRDWDKKQLIGPIDEALEVAKAVREEFGNFGLMWDLSHAPMLGEKPEDLKRVTEYLAHIHVGCTKKLPDGTLKDWHPGFYRPGALNGVNEVRDLIRALHEIGYRGAVGFEVKPEEGQEWLEVVHAAKGVLYTAFARYVDELR